MSHFTVLVTKTNKTPVDEQLAPFDENVEVPRYVEYTKQQLIEKGRKEIEDYKNGLYAEYLADPEKYERECTNPHHMQYIREEFPKKLTWSDEGVYEDKIRYYEPEQIGPNGEVYSTYNPRSKWDWYQIGGRWSGYFKMKPGTTGIKGEHRAKQFDPTTPDLPDDVADIAKVKDIDWQRIEQPVHTFAVLHDGEWYEKGEMGWWAVVSNEKSPEDWQAQFDKIIASLDPEDEITLVDAHI